MIGDLLVNFLNLGKMGIIDVGSADSLPPYWDKYPWYIAHLLRFEPRDKAGQKRYITNVGKALWSTKVKKTLYIYKGLKGSGSSLFQQNNNYVRENFDILNKRGNKKLNSTWFDRSQLVRTERVSCDTLDNLLTEIESEQKYRFLKVDAQGSEYEILEGAKNFLDKNCSAVYLETFKIPLYKGITLYPKVKSHLENRGYYLAKKFPVHGSFASQNDCLFIKKSVNKEDLKIIMKVYSL